MPSIRDAHDRDAILKRFARLQADSRPKWGKLDAVGMVAHVVDAMRSGMGELPVADVGGPLQFWPINTLVMFYLPWPKGAPTAPELIARKPTDLAAELDVLRDVVTRLAAIDEGNAWPRHPAFGKLSGDQWCRLTYRHLDHHLVQFGC